MNLVDTARRIAKANPDASLPCPLCASSVNGANLAGHLAKVHANAATDDALPSWRGIDARIAVTALIAMFPIGLATAASLFLEVPREASIALVIVLGIVVALALCALLRLIPARVTLFDNAIVVRGLVARRAADLPCELEMGTITESRPEYATNIETNVRSLTVDAGTYLRFLGAHEVTVACRAKAARLGAARGPRRTRWDIELRRDSFVALQYALIERGLLAVDRGALPTSAS